MAPKRVSLKGIKTLTFYQDELTTSRRSSPIPQLQCEGKACSRFQPEVIQCSNMGDDGSGGVQWRCDTDLPVDFRLGKVEVSCEGWSKPGDAYVLQGSCGLTYNLHYTHPSNDPYSSSHSLPTPAERLLAKSFNYIFYLIFGILLYSLLRKILLKLQPRIAPPPASSFFPWFGGGGGGGGPGFNGGGGRGPPPPYTKHPDEPTTTTGGTTVNNIWTGLALGGAAGYLAATRNRDNNGGDLRDRPLRRGGRVDWDDDGDRGIGSSNGPMRRATGFGGTTTR